jgi:hypothetical protein
MEESHSWGATRLPPLSVLRHGLYCGSASYLIWLVDRPYLRHFPQSRRLISFYRTLAHHRRGKHPLHPSVPVTESCRNGTNQEQTALTRCKPLHYTDLQNRLQDYTSRHRAHNWVSKPYNVRPLEGETTQNDRTFYYCCCRLADTCTALQIRT